MHQNDSRRWLGWAFLACWLALAGAAGSLTAQTVSLRTDAPAEVGLDHPLDAVLQLAQDECEYLERTVQDYTCRIVKRERIDGVLQSQQFLRAKVRPATSVAGAADRPFAVMLDFLAPQKVAGRRVLFVEGAFDGKMLVRQREGGITYRITPDGGLAARESSMPITSIGFHNMLREAIKQMEDDIAADPTGENTRVEQFPSAKIDGRPCLGIRITHPRRQPNLDFHVAHVFLDSQWRLPVRLDFYDWPEAAGGQPVLLGEYTYQDVKLNVGLTDGDFDPAALGLHYQK
jgi:hypothetical protein